MFALTNAPTFTQDAAISTNTGNTATSVADIDTKLTTTANGLKVDGSAVTQPVSFAAASNAAVTSVASSQSNVQLLASNSARKGAMFYMDGTSNLYLKLGTTASTTSFTIKIPSTGYYELPQSIYTGEIDGIWDGTNGSVRITEIS